VPPLSDRPAGWIPCGDNRSVGDDLPTGTLTLLFSDIEGSTALLRRLGDRYGAALSIQRALLRACFAEYGGREMGTEGDSFFVVFQSAGAAASCCVAAQRALAAQAWPEGVPVRVRMGLHSGEPIPHEDNYTGMDVHRAARIAATAHGGQVVLSEATRLLAAARLAAEVSIRDLGFHRLKDIAASAGNTEILATTLELSAAVAAELGEGLRAARLAGAAETVRLLAGMPILEFDATLLERFLAPARAAIARHEWDAEFGTGRALTQQQAVALLLAQD
jgi:class 3 adenylate cyclase